MIDAMLILTVAMIATAEPAALFAAIRWIARRIRP